MAYPTFTQLLGSRPVYVDDRAIDTDVYGGLHIRSFYQRRKSRFDIKHAITPADYATLLAFYDANRLNSFDFVWDMDQATYTVIFLGAPVCDTSDPTLYEVGVSLQET